jgi:anti-sigma regulatory factor (Ser/Thr protein kinase)
VWSGLTAAEVQEWTRYESILNTAFAGSPAWIVCPYDARSLPPSIVEDSACTHPRLVRDGALRSSSRFMEAPAFMRHMDLRRRLIEPPGQPVQMWFDGDLAALRRFVQDVAGLAALGSGRTLDAEVAINEIVTNVLVHATGRADIRAWSVDGKLVCEVADDGPGILDPLAGRLPPGVESSNGRGLWLARQLCHLVEVSTVGGQGTTVRVHIRR